MSIEDIRACASGCLSACMGVSSGICETITAWGAVHCGTNVGRATFTFDWQLHQL